MSATDIIAELPKLTPNELEIVDTRLHELMQPAKSGTGKSWGEALLEVAGKAKGLPRDCARNHDHYLHGTPKKP